MVYDSYEFGKYLMELRKKYNITMNVVCDGICDVSVMSRIENGEREVSKLVQDRLLGRLGVAPENFENMVFSDEYERWKVRQKIVSLILNEKTDEAEVFLEKMFADNRLCERRNQAEDLDAILEMQFYYAMKAQIQCYRGDDVRKIKETYKLALKQTVDGFEKSTGVSSFFKSHRFSVEELNLLIEYGRCLAVNRGITFIRNIIEYIASSAFDMLAKAKVYPKAVYFLYILECKRGIENNKKITQLLEYITSAIEYLRDSLRTFYMCELLEAKMKLIILCDESIASKYNIKINDLQDRRIVDTDYMDRYGNTDKYSLEEQYVWCRCSQLVLDDMYARSGVRSDTFEYCYIYVDRDVYCIEDVIRIRRNMFNISMEKLCHGICSERTISRIERKLVKPQSATIHKLFERLGLSCEFSKTELVSSDINAQDILAQIRIHLSNGDPDIVNELLDKLGGYVDFNIPQNRQIMFRMKACNMRMARKISDVEYVQCIKEALECTIPYSVAVADCEKYMSNGEISCINNILVTKSLEIKEVEECYIALFKLYQKDKDMIINFLSMYEFVMQTVASYCGNCGRYDDADDIENILFVNTMMNRRLTVVPQVVYCLLWNNLQRKNKNLPLKCDADKALELKKCLILNDIAKNNRSYKFIGNIIQKQ